MTASDSTEDRAAAPDGRGEGGERFDVFLSYSRSDAAFVERIAERLKRGRLEPWLDLWRLVPGQDWQVGLAEGLRASRSCALFVGPHDRGAWASQEAAVALDRAARDPEFRVFLVLLPGLPEPFDAAELSPFVARYTWVDYRRGLDDGRAFERLVAAVKGVAPGPEVPIAPDGEVCPYRGLEVFEEEHAQFFFGREADVQRLLEQLKGTRFLAVLGASGSGKSSLVRAGLIPALRQMEEAWEIVALRPGAHPLEALAARVASFDGGAAMQQTLDGLAEDPRSLHLAASLALVERRAAARVLVVVDQFEEVFSLCRDERDRSGFFANLLYAATVPSGRCGVLLTMRADFYHRCGAYPELSQQLAARQYLVSPLQSDGLRQAIEEPARRVGLALEPGLAATILEDVAAEPGALPLLEHALLELWAHRSGGLLTLDGYRASGGVQGAIAQRAEQVYGALSPQAQEVARRTFLRLTQPGEGTEDTRRRAALTELGGAAFAEALDRLVAARLLTASRDEALGGEVVEVAHEALIRGWPRLRTWIEEDRYGLRIHRRLTEAAAEWKALDRDASVLYRGSRLVAAREWAHDHAAHLSDAEREFLHASAAAATVEFQRQRRQTRRLRVLAVGLMALLIAALSSTVVALRQTRRADERAATAQSGELAARALAVLAVDPGESLRLAVEAIHERSTVEARDALRQSFVASHVRHVLSAGNSEINHVTFSSDGKLLVTAPSSADDPPRVWDVKTGRQIAALEGSLHIASEIRFSRDNTMLVTAGQELRVWQPQSGKRLATLRPMGDTSDSFDGIFFSPDGRFLAAGTIEGRMYILDTGTWNRLKTLAGKPMGFSVDGTRLLTVERGQALVRRTGSWELEKRLPESEISCAAFSPDGASLVTSSATGIHVTSTTSWRVIDTLEPGDDNVCPFFHADGRLLSTGSRAWKTRSWKRRAWNLPSGRELDLPQSLSPDWRLVASTRGDGTVQIVDTSSGEIVEVLRGHRAEGLSAAFSPDGLEIATGSGDGTARLWATPRTQVSVFRGHRDWIENAAITPNGLNAITAASDGTVRVWDVRTGRQKKVLLTIPDACRIGSGHTRASKLGRVALSNDGRFLLIGVQTGIVDIDQGTCSGSYPGSAGSTQVWDAERWSRVAVLPGSEFAVSANGPFVATISAIGRAHVYDTQTRMLIAARGTQRDYLRSAEFGGNGLILSRGRTLQVWRATTGEQVSVFRTGKNYIADAVFAPDARYIVTTGEDDAVTIRSASDGKIVTVLRHGALDPVAAFSLDSKRLVTSGDTTRLWNVDTWQKLADLTGRFVSFSRDSRFLVTATDDGTVHLWTSTGERVMAIARYEERPTAAFDASARLVVIGGEDGTARVFRCEVCRPIDEIERVAVSRLAAMASRAKAR